MNLHKPVYTAIHTNPVDKIIKFSFGNCFTLSLSL